MALMMVGLEIHFTNAYNMRTSIKLVPSHTCDGRTSFTFICYSPRELLFYPTINSNQQMANKIQRTYSHKMSHVLNHTNETSHLSMFDNLLAYRLTSLPVNDGGEGVLEENSECKTL